MKEGESIDPFKYEKEVKIRLVGNSDFDFNYVPQEVSNFKIKYFQEEEREELEEIPEKPEVSPESEERGEEDSNSEEREEELLPKKNPRMPTIQASEFEGGRRMSKTIQKRQVINKVTKLSLPIEPSTYLEAITCIEGDRWTATIMKR